MGGVKLKFIGDKRGRIPFVALGVVLMIGSVITSGIITNLEKEYSKEISIPLEGESVKYLIKCAEADIGRALNYAFMQALEIIGENPVTKSNLDTYPAAREYADGDGDGYPEIAASSGGNDDRTIDTLAEAIEFNKNWARNIARVKLNNYLNANFRHNIYNNGRYAVNIKEEIKDWRDIKIDELQMELERNIPDFLEELVTGYSNPIYSTYWKASVELSIEITDLSSSESWEMIINPSTLITSRTPFLFEIAKTYEEAITGGILDNALQSMVTIISEIYTEARSLLQYAGTFDIQNIVHNLWLQYVTNAANTAIEYIIFNSVDPMTLVTLVLHAKDLTATKSPTQEEIQQILQQGASFLIDASKDVLNTLKESERENAEAIINSPPIEDRHVVNLSIASIAEDILYNVTYTYYYHNQNGNILLENKFKGYRHKDKEDYVLGNHKRKAFNRYLDKDKINQSVIEEIEKEIKGVYSVGFRTMVDRSLESSGYEHNWSPGLHDELVKTEKWEKIKQECMDKELKEDEIIPFLPYEETWDVEWQREEKWEICDEWNATANKCEGSHIEIHIFKERYRIKFTVIPTFCPTDVDNIFYPQTIFGTPPHINERIDDNLNAVLVDYSGHFIRKRESVLNSRTDETDDNEIYEAYDGKVNYNVDWLDGKDGEVVVALKNVIERIKEDKNIYGNIYRKYKSLSTLEDIHSMIDALLENFTKRESYYENTGYYSTVNGYKSTGAKVVAEMRIWFVKKIRERIEKFLLQLSDIRKQIDKELDKYAKGNFRYDDYEDIKQNYGSLSNLGSIHFGTTMKLANKRWNEKIALAIDQVPDYLDKDQSEQEEKWYFNIKNICLFWPTGLPILPTPVTPWVVTINCWYIEINGSFESFKILDTNDETNPSALLGHSEMVYVREDELVVDPTKSDIVIGVTEPIKFNFKTLNIGIIPAGKLPFGDLEPIEEG